MCNRRLNYEGLAGYRKFEGDSLINIQVRKTDYILRREVGPERPLYVLSRSCTVHSPMFPRPIRKSAMPTSENVLP